MLDIPAHPNGLPVKVFNAHLDALMTTGQLNPDIIPYMDARQQDIINEVKKSINRFKSKHARETTQHTA